MIAAFALRATAPRPFARRAMAARPKALTGPKTDHYTGPLAGSELATSKGIAGGIE